MGELGEYWRDVNKYFEDRNKNPEKYFSKEEIEAYKKRQKRRTEKYNKRVESINNICKELGIELKKYPATGQYSFGKILDWWTTTGTAIERKSRKRHNIQMYEINKLKQILQKHET